VTYTVAEDVYADVDYELNVTYDPDLRPPNAFSGHARAMFEIIADHDGADFCNFCYGAEIIDD
jgi:hypothetical protein